MSTLAEQREVAYKEAESLIEKVKSGDEAAIEQAESAVNRLKELNDLHAKAEKSDQLFRSLAGSPTVEKSRDDQDAVAAFAKSVLAGTKGRFALAGTKANTDPSTTGGASGVLSPWASFYDQALVTGYRRRPTVTDLLPQVSVNVPTIRYLVEGALEGSVTSVAEGAAKPRIHYVNPSVVTETVSKIAAYTKISDEMFKDLPFLVSEINGRLVYDLSLEEEDQILNGDGTGEDLSGILDRSIGTEISTDQDENVDAIYRAMTEIQNDTGFGPDGIVIHPTDYETIRLSKDLNGQYFGGGFFSGQYGNGSLEWQPPIWGIRTVVTPVIDAGTVLVGAFQQSSTLYRNGGVTVESTNTNEDDFIKNLVTVLAETRVALAVRKPLGFVAVSLSAS